MPSSGFSEKKNLNFFGGDFDHKKVKKKGRESKTKNSWIKKVYEKCPKWIITRKLNQFAWLTNVFTDSTFYVKRVIAFFLIGVAVFEEKSIRTQFGLGDSFNALVIEIALLGVRKKSIIFWTVKRCYNKRCFFFAYMKWREMSTLSYASRPSLLSEP